MERTLILLKPECVQRPQYIIEEILSIWTNKQYRIVDSKSGYASKEMVEKHYAEHKEKPFFKDLVDHMCSGVLCCYIFEGPNLVSFSRKVLGATDPAKAEPWTIRGRFATEMNRNMVHASDSVESAEREIKIWFP